MNKRQFMKVVILASLTASHIVLFVTFLFALFNDYEIMVYINNYGEAKIELVWFVFVTMATFWYMKEMVNDMVREK